MSTEIRSCKKCSVTFSVEPDDMTFYSKMNVPLPSACPDCRFRMRAMWRNETTLYTGRNCGLCNKSIITMYNPSKPYTVYCYDCYYSEKWDPRQYAKSYDFSRSFYEQFNELLISVPKIATYLSLGDGQNIRSEYVNMASGCKDSYLVFNTSQVEEVLYSRGLRNCRESSDLYFATNVERSYESVNVQKSSGIFWGTDIVGSLNSYFVYNCSGLNDCFGCVNLRNKSYCWFNEQLSKDEYNRRLEEVLGSYSKIKEMLEKFNTFRLSFPVRENHNIKTFDSSGDYLFECKNTKHSFEVTNSEDSRYICFSKAIKDSLGTIGYGTNSQLLLEVVATGHSSSVIGTYGAENCSDIIAGFYIRNCKNSIGCDSLKNGEYCILNKQYHKEEYEKIRQHIISELSDLGLYGLMLPPELSPFGYNETIGQDNMPLTREKAIQLGFGWQDNTQKTVGRETIMPDEIPDRIQDTTDSITTEILRCIDCDRNYKITEQEFFFYKRMVLPVPRKCFFCRHQDRIIRRGPYQFWDRVCMHCNKKINTNISPDRQEKVYCEDCYKREVL